ncbi:MAG: hypothetical protein IH877_10160 [Gemmatimonadetes bacterium]|nr:hypothetical protein [Gemmatimonadota bacterium]
MDPRVIELRVHTEVLGRAKRRALGKIALSVNSDKWPKRALVLDCETTTDERQSLIFGCYQYCRLNGTGYAMVLEGVFYADELASESVVILRQYCKAHKLQCLTRSEFMKKVFWRAIRAEALVVGFNLPFDLSRLAVECSQARRRNRVWSLVMSQYTDPKTGQCRENLFRPRIIVTPINSKAAFIRFAGVSSPSKKTGRILVRYTSSRFLDLRTLGWALRNRSYSLQGACEAFGVPGKLSHEPTGRVSLDEIEYCRQDVRATVDLLNAMRTEFDQHPIELQPDRAYSPASIAKAYLKAMGVVPPLRKFPVPPSLLGATMQAFYGGRAEARIRHTPVPVVSTDFRSEYPTVNTLMGHWRLLTAKHLRIDEATEEVRSLLANLTLDAVFNPDFWKRLSFFALVLPAGDVLPVRTTYDGTTTNIGVNPLTSKEPIWYAGPDVVATTLLTGRPPTILRAFKLKPKGQQAGLKPVALQGMVKIDPRKDDFFKKVIEARAQVKTDKRLAASEREALSYFLKILGNAGSYGLFVEVNPERVGTNAKTGKPARVKIQVFPGEQVFETTSEVVENPGPWYFPPLAALISAGGRLLLAMLERTVADAGGSYLLCDTDSMAIVASETGGLVPCVGGKVRMADGRDAVKALSWAEVNAIVERFEQLNPYDRTVVRAPFLKIEDVNFGPGVT